MLARFGIRPSKRWGQHFLVSPRVLRETLDAAALSPEDAVLEIGAGIGTLTVALASRAGWVTAVEVDRGLLPPLRAVVAHSPNVTVVEGDILRLSLEPLFRGPAGAPRKVVANLPYNVASAVLMRLLERSPGPAAPPGLTKIVVAVQREVAERLCAKPGRRTYGLLSVAVQYRAVPRIVARIPPGAFYPAPEVESALVEMTPRPRPAVPVADEAAFFRLVAAGFGQRRKTLHNAVAAGLGLSRNAVAAACRTAGVDPGARAETLDLDAFARLSAALAQEGPAP